VSRRRRPRNIAARGGPGAPCNLPRAAREQANPDDLIERLGRILLDCGIKRSAELGLLGAVHALIACGDGSPLPTGANKDGRRVCASSPGASGLSGAGRGRLTAAARGGAIPSTTLYFAYGSNLSARGWDAWRRARGLPPGLLRPVGPAWLPGRELAFDYFSRGRGGGALDVVERFGQAAPGYLFEVAAGGRGALDRKEGVPRNYRPLRAVALIPGGGAAAVLTYQASPDRRQGFTPPTAAYLAEVREGYRDRRLRDDLMLRAAARGERPPLAVTRLFVRARRRPLLESLSLLGAHTASIAGVRGEVVELADAAGALRRLDEADGARGRRAPGARGGRVLVEVPGARGRRDLAWTYPAGDGDGGALPARGLLEPP